jgi:hypothetical protein
MASSDLALIFTATAVSPIVNLFMTAAGARTFSSVRHALSKHALKSMKRI